MVMVELVVVHNSALVLGIKHCTVSACSPSACLVACIQLLVCLPAVINLLKHAGDELSTQSNPVNLCQLMANVYI